MRSVLAALARARSRVPKWLAGALAVIAVMCAAAAVAASLRRGTQPVREFVDAFVIPAPANLAYAAFIGVLAAAVARRKRVAYWVLVGYLLVGVLSGAVLVGLIAGGLGERLVDDSGRRVFQSGFQIAGAWVSTIISLLVLAAVASCRSEFYARVRKGSLRRAVLVFAVLSAMFTGFGYLIVSAAPGSVRGPANRFTYAAERVLGGAVRLDFTRAGRTAGWVNLLLGLFGAIALFTALYVLLRSQRAQAVLGPLDEQRIRVLLDRYGSDDSLGYFATRRDKAVIFSPSGKAAVTYRVVGGVSLASADPIGDREAWPQAIKLWLEQARTYAWTPAVIGASEAGAQLFARAGLKVMHIGDEAILTPAGFTLAGREMRPVRQAVNRVERAGYTTRIRRHADVPPAEMTKAVQLADAWRDTDAERGFSMALSRLGDPADGDCVLVEALNGSGVPAALLSFSPWGRDGLSLDLMRRDGTAENGLVEFMIAGLMAGAHELGVTRVSLNFAAFRTVFEEGGRIGAGPVLRAWRSVLLFFSRWWQMESLYRANAKFQPQWVPRYLCFGERRDLATVGLASVVAEGLLRLPRAPAVPLDHQPAQPFAGSMPAIFNHAGACAPIAGSLDGLPVGDRTSKEVALVRTRAAIVRSLRAGLEDRDFVEVETPILQRIRAEVRMNPFVENYVKQLAAGGLDRVYELGRVQRDEAVSPRHAAQFTMLEAHQAYADYDTMRELTRHLVQAAAMAANGRPVAYRVDGTGNRESVDLSGEWPAIRVHDAISTALGEQVDADTAISMLKALCDKANVSYRNTWTASDLTLELFERLVEPRTTAPTFYLDFPAETAPLACANRNDPRLAERWDLVAGGIDLGTAYSEIFDDRERRKRMTAAALRAGDKSQAMDDDEDFLPALAQGIPPSGCLAIDVDRLVILLTGAPIRPTEATMVRLAGG